MLEAITGKMWETSVGGGGGGGGNFLVEKKKKTRRADILGGEMLFPHLGKREFHLRDQQALLTSERVHGKGKGGGERLRGRKRKSSEKGVDLARERAGQKARRKEIHFAKPDPHTKEARLLCSIGKRTLKSRRKQKG